MESTSTYPAASANLHTRVVTFLMFVHTLQPNYATRAAENYAKLDPFQLATMPDDLTREMLKLSDER